MPEDPLTVGELGRMVGALRADLQTMVVGLNSRLDRVVSTEVYTLQSAHTDQRINDQARELQAARDEHKKLEDAFEAYQKSELARRERDRQARLYQMILPILVCLVSSAIAIWAVVK